MAETSTYPPASEYPPELGGVQLSVYIDVFTERKGGCAVRFWAPEGSELVAKHGSAGRALAACRDVIIDDLSFLIDVTQDGE